MVIYYKVKLNKKEKNEIRKTIKERGFTTREWTSRCAGKKVSNAGISNILTYGIVSQKKYERYLKDLNLSFFQDFKWTEEVE
jgi:hypothetical protein